MRRQLSTENCMTHALGPVVGNALQTKPKAPKPHLSERLATLRYTSAGVLSESDGKLSFAPSYAGECPVSLPVVYREPAYVPKTDFGVAVEPAATVMVKAEAVDSMTIPWQVGDRVRKAQGHINANCTAVVMRIDDLSDEGVRVHLKWDKNPDSDDGKFILHKTRHRDYLEVIERSGAKPAAWDPMAEPLQVGDEVEVVFHLWSKRGQRDIVTEVRPGKGVVCKDSGGWGSRSSLKLIRKAG
jgi:hypothetical protein